MQREVNNILKQSKHKAMTLVQKISYLKENGYIEESHTELIKTFTSKDKNRRFSLRDLIYRWNSLIIF